ncbi:MAG TPA: hypothetical protein VIY70_08290 [Acidimicrobiia bacterium]
MTGGISIDPRFQGISGIGQGGHFAGLLAERRRAGTRVWFRAPIPLGRRLNLDERGATLVVRDGATEIALAENASVEADPPPFVSLAAAEKGRSWAVGRHLPRVEGCFSCGMGPESLRIHAGRVDEELYATPYTPPAWTAGPDGTVLDRFLWAPIDCAAGWRVSLDEPQRPAVTGWLTAEIATAVTPGTPLVVVATAEDGWTGRKRMASSAVYTGDGTLVAKSESLWIALTGAQTPGQ